MLQWPIKSGALSNQSESQFNVAMQQRSSQTENDHTKIAIIALIRSFEPGSTKRISFGVLISISIHYCMPI